MSMPPADVSPFELWTQITAMPRPHRLVDFPRKDESGDPIGQVAMVVLTTAEAMAATAASDRFVRKIMKTEGSLPASGERSDGYTTLYEHRSSLEILHRVCRRAGDVTRPFFPSPEKIADALTTDEIGVLFASYNIVRAEIGPIVSQMSQDEMEAWIEKLATGGAADPLAFFTLAARSDLLMFLARAWWDARTDSSSPTTPPAVST